MRIRQQYFLAAALAVVVGLAYATSFQAGFPQDNRGRILEDPRIRSVSVENLRLIVAEDYWWPVEQSGLYRPITTLTYLLNYAVLGNGERPGGYHLINLLIHLANVWMVFALFQRSRISAPWAFFGAAMFGVHPLGTEAVTNIVGRADALAALAVLLSVWLWMQGRCVAAAVAALAGMLCKESAVVAVGLIGVYELAHGRRLGRLALVFAGPVMLWAVLRWRILGTMDVTYVPFADNPLIGAGLLDARFTALKVLGMYGGKMIWPVRLSCDYSYNQIPIVSAMSVSGVVVLLGVLGAVAGMVWVWRKNKVAGMLLVWGPVAFLPVSNLVLLVGSMMAERFTYLPLVGFCGAIALAAQGLCDTRHRLIMPATLACALILGGLGVRTGIRNLDWRDDVTLYGAAIAASPNSARVHAAYAFALFRSDPAGNEVDRVIAHAERSVEIYGDDGTVWGQLGSYRAMKAEMIGGTNDWYHQALDALERAVALSSKSGGEKGTGKLLWNLGLCHVRLGDFQKALDTFQRWVEVEPFEAEAHVAVGSALLGLGRSDEAVWVFHRALICDQESQEAKRLLVEIYRLKSTADGCELLTKEAKSSVNFACEEVKRSRCEACRWFEKRIVTREILERCRSFQCLWKDGYHFPAW
jgi:hypothetical protein